MVAYFSWSAVIRTCGDTGEKYVRTIQSILSQSIPPEEIVVVIPEGSTLDYISGKERIVYSKKGMVTQRAVGLKEARSEFLLVADDDVSFPPDFVERCYGYLNDKDLDCVLPGWGGTPVVYSLKSRIKGFIRGDLYCSKKSSEWLDTVTLSAGHKVYVNSVSPDKVYLCQTGCFQLFFISKQAAERVHFEDDVWLEQGRISSYAFMDDQVFFYKLYRLRGRIAYCQSVSYCHLDAASGRKAKSKLEERRIRYYTDRRNRYIFWRKYIMSGGTPIHTFLSFLAWSFSTFGYILYTTMINLNPSYWPALKAMRLGIIDGKRFFSLDRIK